VALTKALAVRDLDTRNLDMSPPPQTPITTRKPEVPPCRVKGTTYTKDASKYLGAIF